TYLLRAGERVGEIDVIFEYEAQAYRVERGLGLQNKRRSKVILLEDGSIEAEGDSEVSAYLCRLLRFPDPVRLSELFAKLVGVKQGRLTWPFDSKPKAAREHFDPLLDVEIFRECFDYLGPVVKRFTESAQLRDRELAGISERIRERADSPEKLKLRQQEAAELERKVELARKEKKDADDQKQVHEQKEQAFRDSKAALDAASSEFKLTVQKKQDAERRVHEARQAVEAVNANQAFYQNFVKAEEQLRRLQDLQRDKNRLLEQRAEASNQRTAAEEKARSARQQAGGFKEQMLARTQKAGELRQRIEQGLKAMQDGKAEFEKLSAATDAARRSREALDHWSKTLEKEVGRLATVTDNILADSKTVTEWDTKALTQARTGEEEAARAEQALIKKLTEIQKVHESVSDQLDQIRGGVCPFLKEKCRQFEPKKVRSDVSDQAKEIKRLSRELQDASAAHKQTRDRVQRLTKDEGRLSELKKSISKEIESLIQGGNNLFPSAIQRHVESLREYLPQHASRLQLQPPVPFAAEKYHARGGREFDEAPLQELLKLQQAFCREVSGAVEKASGDLEDRFESFDKQRAERVGAERDTINQQKLLQETESEARELTDKIQTREQEATKAGEAASSAVKLLLGLDEKLQPLSRLEDDLAEQQRLKDANSGGYQNYLGAKPLADRIPELVQVLNQSNEAELRAGEFLRQKDASHETTKREFDSSALAAARQRAEEMGRRLAIEQTNWDNVCKEVQREQARFIEWQSACTEKETALTDKHRSEACATLTQSARDILKDSASMVAQHVCRLIAGRAQQIFNQINPDPAELEWNAERYSLRISPGERRFAMLSGGEQTKIALAMTLAMLREFSGLNFCVFDEPTYGVDADSREKLADAILQLQHAGENRLDQLLLVSHDDAFEGKTENVVLIRKTASEGSLPVESL
ncbi:MAG TPA: SMC family ATPase, partial [Verrucomicrobiae bacterium]|nr:SMC family ATPase [Verrucomicrobiae bacterium]